MRYVLPALLMFAAPAFASCPEPPDHEVRLSELITSVQVAPDASAAQRIANDMWEIWADAPDDEAQRMLDDGLARRAGYDFDGAAKAFDLLIAYCPNYAEGYNQRAFVRFIRQDFEPALQDLNRAIELSPRHIAALAGKALTLIGLQRHDEAQVVLRQALALNPWLPERRFLKGEMPIPETEL